MPGITDAKRDTKIKALIFGKFKTGKTAGAATFPRPNFLDFDQGILTVTNPELEKKYQYSKAGIMYEQFVETGLNKQGIDLTHNAYDDACRYFDECMKPSGKWKSPRTGQTYDVGVDMFDTWVIDSGSTLTQAARNKAIILMGTKEFAQKQMSHTHAAAIKTGMLVPKIQDFGAERSLVEQFIDMVRTTNKNVLLLCHEKEQWEGEGNDAHLVGYVPLFTGQSTELIPIKFDEVYNLRTRKEGLNTVRYLQTAPDGLRACGSRLGVPDGTVFEYGALRQALNLT